MTVPGTDLSHWNEHPVLDGYDFVFHKATQGNTYTDPLYRERVQWIRDQGKIFGAYMFPVPHVDYQEQVDHFRAVAGIEPGDLVACDFEDNGQWHSYTAGYLSNMAEITMHLLAAAFPNNRVLLYCNRTTYRDMVAAHEVPTGDGLWIASPGSAPTMPWVIWQYGNGALDYDRANFDTTDDMLTWCHGDKPPARNPQEKLIIVE